MTVTINTYRGRFDLCRPDKWEWQLRLSTPHGNVSELFDDEPDVPGVEEALDMIEARQKDYFFKSSRDETMKTVAVIRENLLECEALFLEGEIERLEKKRGRLNDDISRKRETLGYIRDEMKAAP